MVRYVELAIVLVLGALAWPTLHGLVLPASAQPATECGRYAESPCFVALVECIHSYSSECQVSGTDWQLVKPSH